MFVKRIANFRETFWSFCDFFNQSEGEVPLMKNKILSTALIAVLIVAGALITDIVSPLVG